MPYVSSKSSIQLSGVFYLNIQIINFISSRFRTLVLVWVINHHILLKFDGNRDYEIFLVNFLFSVLFFVLFFIYDSPTIYFGQMKRWDLFRLGLLWVKKTFKQVLKKWERLFDFITAFAINIYFYQCLVYLRKFKHYLFKNN